jgi:D-3-phosphoglycerate dehydrogenase
MVPHVVLMTDNDLPGHDAQNVLEAAGHEVIHGGSPDAASRADEVTALLVQWATISDDVMATFPKLQFISRLGIGCDMIDIGAATQRGIQVANTPAYCTEEVASHTIAMILSLTRGLVSYDRAVQNGQWSAVSTPPRAARPSSTVVSVVGFGRIGSLVADGCRALGYSVLVFDPLVPEATVAQAGHQSVTLDDALREADILTLHAPLTDTTRHLVNADTLKTMKTGAMVVNTCRGGLIDEQALEASLRDGHLAGAALDVFVTEPLPENSGLRGLDNVMLTPHASWYSPEALVELPRQAAGNIVNFFAGTPVPSILNPRVT